MSRRRTGSLDRILGRLDDLAPENLAGIVRRLARERDLLETVFDTVREGVLVTDAHAVIDYANRAGAALIGLKPADVGKAVLWKWAPDLAKSFPLGLAAGASGLSSAREIEVAYPERRILRVQVSPIDGAADEDEARFVVILTDVSEERVSTEERIEDERMNSIRMLAAGVAHEIGNPLNSLGIHLQLMNRRLTALAATPERDKLRDSVEICVSEIRRLDDILKNFLHAIGPRPPDLSEVALVGLVDEVLAIQRGEMMNLGVRVEIDLPTGEVPAVLGDRDQLKQVFFNIIKNAMEAMDAGGLVAITASSDDNDVVVSIRDTGAGMERDEVSRMFDPFFTTKSGGHGLGMMIVMRILRAHGARIDVDSAPGRGTTVTLRFPRIHRRVRLLESEG